MAQRRDRLETRRCSVGDARQEWGPAVGARPRRRLGRGACPPGCQEPAACQGRSRARSPTVWGQDPDSAAREACPVDPTAKAGASPQSWRSTLVSGLAQQRSGFSLWFQNASGFGGCWAWADTPGTRPACPAPLGRVPGHLRGLVSLGPRVPHSGLAPRGPAAVRVSTGSAWAFDVCKKTTCGPCGHVAARLQSRAGDDSEVPPRLLQPPRSWV